jgi:glucosamine 6-phosphate synthetase-like amidotransferase/phosphosugar isomerase protein
MLLFPTERTQAEWNKLRQLFTQTFVFNQERGREASGLVRFERDGTFSLFKGPFPVSQLVMTKECQEILSAAGPQTTCILGHTRMPTKGAPEDNVNNHPLRAGPVIGIHNGHIRNDDALFRQLGLPRAGEVDSEIIFRLLATLSPARLNGTYLRSVLNRIQLLRGRFTTLSIDVRKPTRLLAVKADMPLCVHYHAPLQVLCFSSRYLFLRKAFGAAVVTEALPSQYAYLFDAEHLPLHGKHPMQALPLLDHD